MAIHVTRCKRDYFILRIVEFSRYVIIFYMFLIIQKIYILYNLIYVEARGGAVVEALSYKPEGRGIDSRWCNWNFSLT
jgi:hypothetical protein